MPPCHKGRLLWPGSTQAVVASLPTCFNPLKCYAGKMLTQAPHHAHWTPKSGLTKALQTSWRAGGPWKAGVLYGQAGMYVMVCSMEPACTPAYLRRYRGHGGLAVVYPLPLGSHGSGYAAEGIGARSRGSLAMLVHLTIQYMHISFTHEMGMHAQPVGHRTRYLLQCSLCTRTRLRASAPRHMAERC